MKISKENIVYKISIALLVIFWFLSIIYSRIQMKKKEEHSENIYNLELTEKYNYTFKTIPQLERDKRAYEIYLDYLLLKKEEGITNIEEISISTEIIEVKQYLDKIDIQIENSKY